MSTLTKEEMTELARTQVEHWQAVVEYYERVGATEELPLARNVLRECRAMLTALEKK